MAATLARTILAAALSAGCAAGAGNTLPGSGDPAPGIYQLTREAPGEVRYTLSIPEGYRVGRPVPLVLALHYGGRITPFYGRGVLEILVGPALAELGAVIVAPDALEGGWDNEASETAVMGLLDHLTATLAIDRRRVICVGYSMGGRGTWYLVGRHPERFSAGIPMAGRAEGEPRVPLYAIHSRVDEVVPFEPTARHIATMKGDVRLVAVEGIRHFQVDGFVEPLRAAVPWIREVWSRR